MKKAIFFRIDEPMTSCIFCQIAQKKKNVEFVAEFEHCFVIEDQYPVAPGHLLIIPYQHTENWFTAPAKTKLEIIEVLDRLKKLLDAKYRPDGYNIGMNCGPVAGQTVMHLHVHLIPRFVGDMEDPRGGVRGVIPSKRVPTNCGFVDFVDYFGRFSIQKWGLISAKVYWPPFLDRKSAQKNRKSDRTTLCRHPLNKNTKWKRSFS